MEYVYGNVSRILRSNLQMFLKVIQIVMVTWSACE